MRDRTRLAVRQKKARIDWLGTEGNIGTRLLLTLAYSSVFGKPLAIADWVRRLYGQTHSSKFSHRLPIENLKKCIIHLWSCDFITYYHMPDGRRLWSFAEKNSRRSGQADSFASHIVDAAVAVNRKARSDRKRSELGSLIRLCEWLPWVDGLVITGSVAVDNARENDDTDLLVIAAPGRLWLARPLLLLFAQLWGKRRTWRGEEANSWCFNLWMESDALRLPTQQRSLYTAYEVCQTDWLIEKNAARKHFYAANRWAARYVPLLFDRSARTPARQLLRQHLVKNILHGVFQPLAFLSYVLDWLNILFYRLQLSYMRRHMTRERVSVKTAAFHPRDTRLQITLLIGELLDAV